MSNDDETVEALADVAQIHPVVDRLRRLLASATLLDLKASADGYWEHRVEAGDLPRVETA